MYCIVNISLLQLHCEYKFSYMSNVFCSFQHRRRLRLIHQLLFRCLRWYWWLKLHRTLLLHPLRYRTMEAEAWTIAMPTAATIAAVSCTSPVLVIPTRTVIQQMRPQDGIEASTIEPRILIVKVEAEPRAIPLTDASSMPASTPTSTAA
jgi:hypothetical protein